MAEYVRAELYKLTHRRVYAAVGLASILGGELLLLLLLKYASGDAVNTFDTVVNVLPMVMSVGLYLVVMLSDMVTSDQYKVDTLKNEVAYGLPRVRIYLGKLLASAVAAVVFCLVILIFYLAVGKVLFPTKSPVGSVLLELGQYLVFSLPLWLGGLGTIHMLLFVLRGSTMAAVCYAVLVAVLGQTLDIMSVFLPAVRTICTVIKQCLLTTPFSTLNGGHPDYLWAWALGMGWLAASTAIGLLIFHKRELG